MNLPPDSLAVHRVQKVMSETRCQASLQTRQERVSSCVALATLRLATMADADLIGATVDAVGIWSPDAA